MIATVETLHLHDAPDCRDQVTETLEPIVGIIDPAALPQTTAHAGISRRKRPFRTRPPVLCSFHHALRARRTI